MLRSVHYETGREKIKRKAKISREPDNWSNENCSTENW